MKEWIIEEWWVWKRWKSGLMEERMNEQVVNKRNIDYVWILSEWVDECPKNSRWCEWIYKQNTVYHLCTLQYDIMQNITFHKKICVSCSMNKADCTHKSIENCIKSENMARDTMPRDQENVSINISTAFLSLKWHHNKRDGVSNHRRLGCLLNRLFMHRSKKTPKLRVTGLCEGNSPATGEFPATRKLFPFDEVITGTKSGNVTS